MNCHTIRELLLTAYPDGELEGELKDTIEKHLRACRECRQLDYTVRERAIMPFKNAIRMKPRDVVWNRIRDALDVEKRQSSACFYDMLRDRLQGICLVPRIVITLAAALIIAAVMVTVIAIKAPMHNQKVANMQSKEEIEYLTHVMGEAEYFSSNDNGGYNTAIEEYFL
ncbi:MAG: anti-sigma factor family protein [bacterium]